MKGYMKGVKINNEDGVRWFNLLDNLAIENILKRKGMLCNVSRIDVRFVIE